MNRTERRAAHRKDLHHQGQARIKARNSTKMLPMVNKHHPALHTQAYDIDPTDTEVIAIANRMHATLVALGSGVALAAPQVGIPMNIVVTTPGLVLYNVRVTPIALSQDQNDEEIDEPEGCLTLPGRWFTVTRFKRAKIEAQRASGEGLQFECIDFHARMWQHEADHLAGRLISDRWPETRAPQLTGKATP